MSVADQTACQIRQLIAVVVAEPVGHVDRGAVLIAAQKLCDGTAGRLADQVPERQIQARCRRQVHAVHDAALADDPHHPLVHGLQVARVHVAHGRQDVVRQRAGDGTGQKPGGQADADVPVIGLDLAEYVVAVLRRLRESRKVDRQPVHTGANVLDSHAAVLLDGAKSRDVDRTCFGKISVEELNAVSVGAA